MEKHDHRHKEELLQQMRRQAEIRPEQNDSEPAAIPVRSKSALLWPEYYY